jgi:hypothetical protein
MAFFAQNKAKLCKNWIITLVFDKNANFFAENWQKSQKIVIITSPYDEAGAGRGCQMVHFNAKNANLGIFRRTLKLKMLVYLMAIWSILRPFCVCNGPLAHCVALWYFLSRFGMLYQAKIWQPCLTGLGTREKNFFPKLQQLVIEMF